MSQAIPTGDVGAGPTAYPDGTRPGGGGPLQTTSPIFLGMPSFQEAAKEALRNTQQRRNLAHATATIRAKRASVVGEVDRWEELRVAGADAKDEALHHLPHYLEQLEANLVANGATVHWARDADEANRIVLDLVRATGSEEVVKVKSMATQEIELNERLEEAGIHAWETDLAELIVQLGHDRPSHILVPAIHRNRAEIREIFRREMGGVGRPAPEDLTDEPARLAEAARLHLREKFLRARVAISGANFAIADTGTLVVVESEGNGRMCLTLPETLISVVGVEKVLPSFADLGTFLQLLPRSSTGERMNPYTSMWSGVREGDGPQDVHVVLLDNGRSHVLADDLGRQALRCIRCSACLNVCPVYERVGGHAYGSVYPGPIGAILTPQLRGLDSPVDQALPFASSLCGACNDVCPVKIPISDILVHLRGKVVEHKTAAHPTAESVMFAGVARTMASSTMLKAAQVGSRLVGGALRRAGRTTVPRLPGLTAWFGERDMTTPPTQSFRLWWRARDKGER